MPKKTLTEKKETKETKNKATEKPVSKTVKTPVEKTTKTETPLALRSPDNVGTKAAKKPTKKTFYHGVGRRKTSIARAILFCEKGELLVNGKPIEVYFKSPLEKTFYTEVFRTTNMIGRWSGKITVSGGGQNSQLSAAVLAISRVLSKFDDRNRSILRKKGYLTRDPRAKERKKPGLMGARKQKQSPKR